MTLLAELIACEDCGKDVSARAQSCPNCGAPVSKVSNSHGRRILIYGTIGFVVLLIIFGVINENDISDTASARSSPSAAALAFCSAIQNTEFEIRCEIGGANQTIKLLMHAENDEARKICTASVSEFRKHSNALRGWSLKIHTLYSSSTTAATCRF